MENRGEIVIYQNKENLERISTVRKFRTTAIRWRKFVTCAIPIQRTDYKSARAMSLCLNHDFNKMNKIRKIKYNTDGNALRYDGDVQHSIFGTLIPNKATVKDYLTVQHEGNRRVIGTIKNTKINLENLENLNKIIVQTIISK